MVVILPYSFRGRWLRFLRVLDSEIVTLYQIVFYACLMMAGAYNLFFAKLPSTATVGVMTGRFYEIWLALLLVFPAVCLVGKRLKGELVYSGMLLQFFGDLATVGAVWAFTISSILTTKWGDEGNFTAFVCVPLSLSICLLIVRDVRRLSQVERRVRR